MTSASATLESPGSRANIATGPAPGGPASDHDDLTSLLRWLADQPDSPSIGLVCAHETGPIRPPTDMVAVRLDGCAGELSLASYLEVAGGGTSQLTVLAPDCPELGAIRATLAVANRLLGPHSDICRLVDTVKKRRLRHAQVYELHRLPLSRRRLLFLTRLDHAWMPDVHADQRTRVLAALRQLSTPDACLNDMSDVLLPSASLVASGCTACGVCVRACPTGAISLEKSSAGGVGSFSLTALVTKCVDCGRCVALCPSGALVRTGQLEWARLADGGTEAIASGSVRRCERCSEDFAGTEASQYCPICQFRLENPFGSRLSL